MRPILLTLAASLLFTTLHAQKPDNTARQALIQYLDNLAANQTAARRIEIAKIQTLAAAKARQDAARATMLRLIGPLPARTPLNPQVLGETLIPGIRIQKIIFDSQPRFHVTALLYLPDPLPTEKLPAILMAPGHGASGKAGDFTFAAAFARAGFAVLSYDPIGQGERLQYPDPAHPDKSLASRPTGEHGEAGLQPVLIGESIAKYFLWDGIRAIDYLQTRPEIEPTRIAAYGCSGGGADTALLGAIDTRLAAVGTACYLTSFDTLLPAIGPQDGEQSTPGWIANGLDFPDYVELAAPRPYAIIATESDMFPFAGAQTTEAEARRFYSLFPDPGLSWRRRGPEYPSNDGPTFIYDSDSARKNLVFIHGPGGHGNLRPIFPQILAFFADRLNANPPSPAPVVPEKETPPADTFQVTPTGQISTSFVHPATVFELNFTHAQNSSRRDLHPVTLMQFQSLVREVTGTTAVLGAPAPSTTPIAQTDTGGIGRRILIHTDPGIDVPAEIYGSPSGKHPAHLVLRDSLDTLTPEEIAAYTKSAQDGTAVYVICPRPSPPGTEEIKSSLMGPFYLLGLRAELVGKTILGMRVDDVIRATDYFAEGSGIEGYKLTAEASGHLALVLLHAAVLDPRLDHVTLTNLPSSYAGLIANPIPKDAPQDILPGVVLHYDTPDLIRFLGPRATVIPQKTTPSPGPTSN